jgi:ComF family protein
MSHNFFTKILWQDFLSLIYPEICVHCGDNLLKNESYLCTICLTSLPVTKYAQEHEQAFFNYFSYLPKVSAAIAYLHFREGGVAQSLLHKLKYKGQPALAVMLGTYFGRHLMRHGHLEADYLLPIPMHPEKERKRGYNQSHEICKGLSAVLNIPIKEQFLVRISDPKTQATSRVVDRWRQLENVYLVEQVNLLKGKSVIIVDDVVTTGATMSTICELLSPYVQRIIILAAVMGK